MMYRTVIAIAATALGAGSAIGQPPVIVEGDPTPSAVVSYADLDITSAAGEDHLVQRIRAASADLCLENNKEDLQVAVERRDCYNTAVTSGMQQMHTAIAARQSGAALAAAALVIRGR